VVQGLCMRIGSWKEGRRETKSDARHWGGRATEREEEGQLGEKEGSERWGEKKGEVKSGSAASFGGGYRKKKKLEEKRASKKGKGSREKPRSGRGWGRENS